MTTPTTRTATATADPTPCAECLGTGFDPSCGGHPTAGGVVTCECEECAGDVAAVDDCRWADDLDASCPDDASRFAAVAARFPTGHAA